MPPTGKKRIMTAGVIACTAKRAATALWTPVAGAEPPEMAKEKVVESTNVAEQADWLKKNAASAEDYLVGLYKSHQVVIFGEAHNIREHKTFLAGLLDRLYSEAEVRCLAWEFSCPEDNQRLERLVMAETFDEKALLAFARDQYLDWNSADHWDLIRGVWRVNKARPAGTTPMRMVGVRSRRLIDSSYEWYSLEPGSRRYWELLEMQRREDDAGMAGEVERQIIDAGVKGFVFVGRSHDMTKYTFPSGPPEWFLNRLGPVDIPEGLFPPDEPFRTIMGRLLYQGFGDAVFQVWPHTGEFPGVEEAMAAAGLSNAGFTVEGSPFEDVRSDPSRFGDAPDVPMKLLAQGLVYLGPRGELHANRVIRGFVSDEMFEQHRPYYEAGYGWSFENAQDVDEYLQKHRWPGRKE